MVSMGQRDLSAGLSRGLGKASDQAGTKSLASLDAGAYAFIRQDLGLLGDGGPDRSALRPLVGRTSGLRRPRAAPWVP